MAGTARTGATGRPAFPPAAGQWRRARPGPAAAGGNWRAQRKKSANAVPSGRRPAQKPARHRSGPPPRPPQATHARAPPSGSGRVENAAAGIVPAALLFHGLGVQHKSVAAAVTGIELRVIVLADRDIDELALHVA